MKENDLVETEYQRSEHSDPKVEDGTQHDGRFQSDTGRSRHISKRLLRLQRVKHLQKGEDEVPEVSPESGKM